MDKSTYIDNRDQDIMISYLQDRIKALEKVIKTQAEVIIVAKQLIAKQDEILKG